MRSIILIVNLFVAIATFVQTRASAATVTSNYTYDAAGFLSSVTKNGTRVASYSYDANGNATNVVTLAGATSYTYDAQDRLLTAGATSFTYTDAGELKTRVTPNGTTGYSYDEFGQLRHVSLPDGRNVDYVLGAPGMRVAKKINGAVVQGFLRDEDEKILAELDGNNTVVSRFVYSDIANGPEYVTRGSDTFRIVADSLGSVRLIVNAQTGAVAQRIDYDEWGQITLDTNPGFQPFGYAGGLYDKDTGLVRFGARDYDPMIRRWTSPDPINFRGSSTNLYTYVNNDPLNLVDPSGLGPMRGSRDDINPITYPGLFKGHKGRPHPTRGQIFYGPYDLRDDLRPDRFNSDYGMTHAGPKIEQISGSQIGGLRSTNPSSP